MIGLTFGRLTVTALSHVDERHRRFYQCSCACGGAKVVQAGLLRSKNTRSCGCLATESRAAQRRPNDAGVITQIILQYKRHARARGIEWYLTFADVDTLVRSPCFYCGNPAGNLKRTKNLREGFPHNGIDRSDAALPYIAENVVPCCGSCNIAKGVMSRDVFLALVRAIAARHPQERFA